MHRGFSCTLIVDIGIRSSVWKFVCAYRTLCSFSFSWSLLLQEKKEKSILLSPTCGTRTLCLISKIQQFYFTIRLSIYILHFYFPTIQTYMLPHSQPILGNTKNPLLAPKALNAFCSLSWITGSSLFYDILLPLTNWINHFLNCYMKVYNVHIQIKL